MKEKLYARIKCGVTKNGNDMIFDGTIGDEIYIYDDNTNELIYYAKFNNEGLHISNFEDKVIDCKVANHKLQDAYKQGQKDFADKVLKQLKEKEGKYAYKKLFREAYGLLFAQHIVEKELEWDKCD